jgi:hypothetical protein
MNPRFSWIQIREQTTNTMRSMPLALKLAMWWCALWPVMISIFLIAVFLSALFVGKYQVNGKEASVFQFLQASWGLFLGFVGFGTMQGILAYALWTQKRWAREFMIGFLIAFVSFFILITVLNWTEMQGSFTEEAIVLIILLGIAVWYLYVKRNVVAYFETKDNIITHS